MNLELSGKLAVVVGGAAGIGKAIATAFAAEGANVVLIDINPATTTTAEGIARAHHVLSQGILVDATNYEAVVASAKSIDSRFHGVDHVVYAAGMGSGKLGFPFWSLEPADWPKVLDVNLIGAVNTAHAFAPLLTAHRESSLTFIASIAGQIGSQTDPPYSAAKAGLLNFSMCAAKDFAPYGVRVNSICPGMIQTDLNRSVWQAWNERQIESNKLTYEAWGESKVRQVAPLGRWQQPEEIGALAVFLASPHACNITGQTLNVDGGQVMHS